jgi:competence protein ComEA
MSLTDAERRGARWLALLFVLGTITDAHRTCHPVMAPEPATSPAPGDTVRPGAVHAALREAAQVSPASPLDLNRATVEDLDRLPGIGPVLARRIVEHRERHGAFRSVDELLGVPGIGARSLERLRPHVEARSR